MLSLAQWSTNTILVCCLINHDVCRQSWKFGLSVTSHISELMKNTLKMRSILSTLHTKATSLDKDCEQRQKVFLYLELSLFDFFINGISEENLCSYSKTGVGKVWPADVFCPARWVVNSTLVSYFPCKNQTRSSYFLKSVARRAQKIFETAHGPKKLPAPALRSYLERLGGNPTKEMSS